MSFIVFVERKNNKFVLRETLKHGAGREAIKFPSPRYGSKQLFQIILRVY